LPAGIRIVAYAVPDTLPGQKAERPPSWLHRSLQEWRNKHYRDSVLSRISRSHEPPPGDDSSMMKSEQVFLPETGRVVRNIIFKRVRVFGPSNITDTTFESSSKVLKLANDMHYDSRMWVIKQSLFVHPGDTINAYELADNERYLRHLPFIQDARIYVVNSTGVSDSVDIDVVTKDVFEYGGEVGELSTTNAKFTAYNNDLFGAGQSLSVGFLWDQTYSPTTGTQIQYTKSNIAGSFIDGSVGYTLLDNNSPQDTGNYEGSYYLSLNRPLFRSVTALIGGLSLANNYSMNIHNFSDTVYRNYKYNIVDVWAGYNFRPQQRKNGEISKRPSLAILLRHYNLYFTKTPDEEIYKTDPVYNNRRYVLGEFAIYKQDFFKSHYFFGFGRTEDIPLGYNIGLYTGEETWEQRQRTYTGINLQKYWVTPLKGLLSTTFGASTFWHNGTESAEDAVIHGAVNYYSRLINLKEGHLREFVTLDYLDCPNPFFYKPLAINGGFGIYGIENTEINGYERLNMRSQTMYYSPLKVYGFKFNFMATVQASQLTYENPNLFDNRILSGFGAGCQIRNENLTFNTLQIDGNYYPFVPPGMRRNFFFEITTVTDFSFNIFPLRSPAYLNFR
jgi:hypothetical protein